MSNNKGRIAVELMEIHCILERARAFHQSSLNGDDIEQLAAHFKKLAELFLTDG